MSMLEKISAPEAFGFFTGAQVQKMDPVLTKADAKAKALWLNVSKILGYIPVVGFISNMGQATTKRLEQFRHLKPTSGFRAAFTLRFLGEGLGVGILFLIPDLIVTIARNAPLANSQQNKRYIGSFGPIKRANSFGAKPISATPKVKLKPWGGTKPKLTISSKV
jgi:hypothetical protein